MTARDSRTKNSEDRTRRDYFMTRVTQSERFDKTQPQIWRSID